MTTYLYRDRLTTRELLPAIGAGVGAGVAVGLTVAYLTQLVLRKRELPSAPPEIPVAPVAPAPARVVAVVRGRE